MIKAVYVPWLHMHQPLILLKADGKEKLISNIEKMLSSPDSGEAGNAKLMFRAYNNPAKYCNRLLKAGYKPKIMLDFSGILLETLEKLSKDKNFVVEVHGEKIKNIIGGYKRVLDKSCIEIAGTAFSHCYFPATPEEDWICQLEKWRNTFGRIFGKRNLNNVKGFWFPEMGIPRFEDNLSKLIKTIRKFYDWCILPLQAVKDYEQLSYEQKIQTACQPHILKVADQSIPVIFRIPADFIDQQAGCDVDCVDKKIKEAVEIFKEVGSKPALIVPASDGENGNVMMNEFFPNTFSPFFKSKINNKISSMTVTEFLHEFYAKNGSIVPDSEIRLKLVGSSWVGTHKFWFEGAKRQQMMEKIHDVSKAVHRLEGEKSELEKLEHLLLIAETSCYVYWGTEFWFDQGKKILGLIQRKIEELSKTRG